MLPGKVNKAPLLGNMAGKGSAARFLDTHPELRRARDNSPIFTALKKQAALPDVGSGEALYLVQGDILGDEDELYLDALAQGACGDAPNNQMRRLFLELSESQQALLHDRFNRK